MQAKNERDFGKSKAMTRVNVKRESPPDVP